MSKKSKNKSPRTVIPKRAFGPTELLKGRGVSHARAIAIQSRQFKSLIGKAKTQRGK